MAFRWTASTASRLRGWKTKIELSRSVHPALAGAPLLIAHRGGAGLAPENTLLAFLNGAEQWRADMIELDVRSSADGHCVAIHDATVDRTTNGSGAVAAMTLAQLQSLDAGHRFTVDGGRTFPYRGKGARIPTIDEVFAALPAMRFTVEVKIATAQKKLFEAIERAGNTGRVIAAGEFRAFRSEFGKYKGCISSCREDAMPFFILHKLRLGFIRMVPADVVQTCEMLGSVRGVTPRFIRELHAKGIQIHVWTVSEIADLNRLLDWGVDGLITDRPDRLAQVLHERVGRPLPPGANPVRQLGI